MATQTQIYQAFFSDQNVSYLQNAIVDAILDQQNIQTQPQNKTSLQVMMQTIFAQLRPSDISQLNSINQEVVDRAVAYMTPQLKNYKFNQDNMGRLPIPMALPMNVRATGLKTGLMKTGV
jgi:hypothetical protein